MPRARKVLSILHHSPRDLTSRRRCGREEGLGLEDSLQLENFSWPFRGPAPIPACTPPPPASSNPWAANGSHRAQCAGAPLMTTIAQACRSGSVNAVSCSNASRAAQRSKSFAHFAVIGVASLRAKAAAPCPMDGSVSCRGGYARSGRRLPQSMIHRPMPIWHHADWLVRIPRSAIMIGFLTGAGRPSVSAPRCLPLWSAIPAS